MNLTLTNLNQPAVAAKDAAPVANDVAMAPAVDVAQAALPQGEANPLLPTLAFAQWLGLDQLAAAPVDAAAMIPDTPAPETDTPADEQQEADHLALGAMAMALPLTPSLQIGQATLAAMVSALPEAPASKKTAAAADSESPLPAVSAVVSRAAPDGVAAPAPALPLTQAQTPAPVEAAHSAAAKPALASLPAEALAVATDGPQEQAAPTTASTASVTLAAPTPTAAQRMPETVALSGPPTAWRQTLQEALGERMQLQVGKHAEQAVIRLEPPMLGRVEIAIRHSAGALEVHITATHGEVLRQLQAVSEGLRNDLAQRQFSEVSLNIGATPKAANGAPMFAGGEGRGRQQEGQQEARRQEQGPGQALAEANLGRTPFSLNGRT